MKKIDLVLILLIISAIGIFVAGLFGNYELVSFLFMVTLTLGVAVLFGTTVTGRISRRAFDGLPPAIGYDYGTDTRLIQTPQEINRAHVERLEKRKQ